MSCVSTSSFAVLINGSPSNFFKVTRGIYQGCPLSPYLFLLIIEGLRRMLSQEKDTKKIKGIKVAGCIFLNHTLFVDDVLIFGVGSIEEWEMYHLIIKLFFLASGIDIIQENSSFLYFDVHETLKD